MNDDFSRLGQVSRLQPQYEMTVKNYVSEVEKTLAGQQSDRQYPREQIAALVLEDLTKKPSAELAGLLNDIDEVAGREFGKMVTENRIDLGTFIKLKNRITEEIFKAVFTHVGYGVDVTDPNVFVDDDRISPYLKADVNQPVKTAISHYIQWANPMASINKAPDNQAKVLTDLLSLVTHYATRVSKSDLPKYASAVCTEIDNACRSSYTDDPEAAHRTAQYLKSILISQLGKIHRHNLSDGKLPGLENFKNSIKDTLTGGKSF